VWQVDGELSFMSHCHCSMCRKHHGAAYGTYVACAAQDFSWLQGQDEISTWKSSEKGVRGFCSRCGSVAPGGAEGRMFFAAGNLDDEIEERSQAHIFVGSKAIWHQIEGELPQHDAFPPGWDAATVETPAVAPSEPGILRGSCLCNGIAWQADGELDGIYSCHCQRCRKARSAAHCSNIFCQADTFTWLRGEELLRSYKVPEAERFGVTFCSVCGSNQPHRSNDRMVIPAGSVDGDPGVRERVHIFVGSKAGWDTIEGDLPQFESYPPARD
jgi:hypothetical protein